MLDFLDECLQILESICIVGSVDFQCEDGEDIFDETRSKLQGGIEFGDVVLEEFVRVFDLLAGWRNRGKVGKREQCREHFVAVAKGILDMRAHENECRVETVGFLELEEFFLGAAEIDIIESRLDREEVEIVVLEFGAL